MRQTVVIPVKSFTMGKRRLAGVADADTRATLGRALAGHVATTVTAAELSPLVVTADPEVMQWAAEAGYASLEDPGAGLDTAVAAGVAWVRQASETWIVLHSDLPLIGVEDILALVDTVRRGESIISPSADGGTSAIGGTETISFSYGVSSFHRHLARLSRPRVLARQGLLLDVDSPADLDAALSTARGRWLRNVIG